MRLLPPHRRLPVLPAEPGTERRIAMIQRRGGYLPHAARAWLELARETRTGV